MFSQNGLKGQLRLCAMKVPEENGNTPPPVKITTPGDRLAGTPIEGFRRYSVRNQRTTGAISNVDGVASGRLNLIRGYDNP